MQKCTEQRDSKYSVTLLSGGVFWKKGVIIILKGGISFSEMHYLTAADSAFAQFRQKLRRAALNQSLS
jgi:hypothetical protein